MPAGIKGKGFVLLLVEDVLGYKVDYAMLVKLYGSSPEAEKRYSPATCIGAQKIPVNGQPDMKRVFTSYVDTEKR